MSQPLPKKATATTRQMIIECLQRDRYRIHPDGQRYLDLKGIRARYIIEDLIQDLSQYNLFELPQQPNNKDKQAAIKYQYIISYTEPDVTIHVKMSPKDNQPPLIYLGFHSHNTGHAPLPQILINPDKPKS